MGRTSSFAGVYMLMNLDERKAYIGESGNVLRRITEHSADSRSIVCKLGHENFVPIILESSITDSRLNDPDYRSEREAYYIKMCQSDDPRFGYNTLKKQWHTRRSLIEGPSKRFNQILTNIQKGTAILVYDTDNKSVMMFFSKKAFADEYGADRSIIARALITGKRYKQYQIYPLNGSQRIENAKLVLFKKMNATSKNGLAQRTIDRYIAGLYACNDFCSQYNLPVVDLSDIMCI